MDLTSRLCAAATLVLLASAAGCSFDNATGPRNAVQVAPHEAIALGTRFSCGITTTGGAYCWGMNREGELGNGATIPTAIPTRIAAQGPFMAVSASESSACALDASGVADCWGAIPDGAPTQTDRAEPVTVQSDVRFTSITVGASFACALDGSGLAYCWGANQAGQLGVGDTASRSSPTPVAGGIRFTQISAGFAHVCGATSGGTLYCWGDNISGQVGDTLRHSRTVMSPFAVPTSVPMRTVSAGSVYTCAVATSGLGYCWGGNTGGQLGDGTTQFRRTPQPIAGGLHFQSISVGRGNSELQHTCGFTTTGAAYCWGANAYGETGGPPETACIGASSAAVCNTLPVAVRHLSAVVAIDAGFAHSCAITRAGAMMCWGDNADGQLGNLSHEQPTAPVAVAGGLLFP